MNKFNLPRCALRTIVAWLEGQADAGVDLNGGIELPWFLQPQLAALLKAAVLADENRPADSADPFERGGLWHRAVNRVMAGLSDECRAMTAHYDYPHGLSLGDGAFHAFMGAIRSFHIGLPSAEALAAADAERAQKAQAEHLAAMAAQAAYEAQSDSHDDSDVYYYT